VFTKLIFGGGGPYAEAYARASPCRYANLAQIRLEPILRKRAEELNPDGIFYHHEVDSLHERKDGLSVDYRSRSSDAEGSLQCQFTLGCDGGRFLADYLGIAWIGETDLVDMVCTVSREDLPIIDYPFLIRLAGVSPLSSASEPAPRY
jgi:2,4-dichlorophenol 6-monooxygenase